MLDISHIKSQFPIFERQINDRLLVFLDSAASAQKPRVVMDAMQDVMERHYANVNRGVYTLSVESTQMVEHVREKIASFINARESSEIIFTKGTTESINLVAHAWGRKFLKKGDVVVLTEMEHHSNIVPWQILREEIGVELVWLKVSDEGYLELPRSNNQLLNNDQFSITQEQLGRVKLVCVTHVSNVLGTINPIKEMVEWGHGLGAKVLVDGAQGVTNVVVDVQDLDCDWYAFSGHKLYGPTGVGVLYGKRDVLEEMNPFLGGGDMILEVHKDRSMYQEIPHKFEAGTPPIVEIVGLGAAVNFVVRVGLEEMREHTVELIEYALHALSEFNVRMDSRFVPPLKLKATRGRRNDKDVVKVYGPKSVMDKGGVVSFTISGVHPHDVASILDEEGIAVRSGHHCAQPLCDRFRESAMVRVSFGVYNSKEDVDVLVRGLEKVIKVFQL